MKKILMSIVVMIMVIAGAAGGGIYAAFMDTESSTGNVLLAGTLDLKTNDADGVTGTLVAGNMKPGDTVGPQTIVLKNAGSINASSLDLYIAYTENDSVEPDPFGVNKTADEYADEILVTTLTYAGTNLLTGITDIDADGVDMKEVAAADLSGLAGIDANSTANFTITIQLKSSIGNDFQADGIDITFTFLLKQ